MELSAKCVKYELDEWELCRWKIKCDDDSCIDNCAINEDKIILRRNKKCQQ